MRRCPFVLIIPVAMCASHAWSQPPEPATPAIEHTGARPINLSAPATHIAPPQRAQEQAFTTQDRAAQWSQPIAIPGLSFGMASSGAGNSAKHYAIVKLQGVTLFGGSVGGSVDGRSAHLVLTWHIEP